jgi:hypothetical protein
VRLIDKAVDLCHFQCSLMFSSTLIMAVNMRLHRDSAGTLELCGVRMQCRQRTTKHQSSNTDSRATAVVLKRADSASPTPTAALLHFERPWTHAAYSKKRLSFQQLLKTRLIHYPWPCPWKRYTHLETQQTARKGRAPA